MSGSTVYVCNMHIVGIKCTSANGVYACDFIFFLSCAGMSEGCGAVTVNIIEHDGWQAGSAGKPLDGIEIMLHDQDDKGEGEVRGKEK